MLLTFSNTRLNLKLDRIEVHSFKLASDIFTCYQRFITSENAIKETTFSSYISMLITKFEKIINLLDSSASHSLLSNGLSCLDDNTIWIQLENVVLRSGHYGNVVNNGILYLARLYNKNDELQPPSKVNIKGYITDISNLHKGSSLLFTQYRSFLISINECNKSQVYLRNLKSSTYGTLVKLIKKDDYRYLLGKFGLKAFALDINLFEDAKKCKKFNSVHFYLMLSHLDSVVLSRKTILVKNKFEMDFTDLYLRSPKLYEDIQCYSSVIGNTLGSHLKDKSIRDKFSAFKRALPILQSVLSSDHYKSLLKKGVYTLISNDEILKNLHDNPRVPKRLFSLIHEICKCVYPEQTPEIVSFKHNLLSFSGINHNHDVQIDFSSIKIISERMYDDFVSFLQLRTKDIDQKNYSIISVYHNYQQVKSLMVKYSKTFTQKHLDILREHGIKGLGVNHNLVQKHLLAELQISVNNNSFNRVTAITYRSSLAWLMREFGMQFNDVYPIKRTKTVKHNQRLNTDDFYTESQCRELAFYIERLLNDESTNLYHRILLNFAKIVLKTAWNISPLLKLKCEDIVEIECPITNKVEYAVVMQKARAGYRNDTYTFKKSELKADVLKSAIVDLLKVRDELTKDLKKNSENSSFVFIYPQQGEIRKLEYGSIKYLSTILKNAGCNVPFVARKIRKGGVNHIYRKVQNSIKKYTDTFNHSFDVFESYYLRIDPNQSRYSLKQATKIMADYFTGKKISSDIHIITDIAAHQHQVVPTGTCAAKKNTEEALRYDREHRKLHQDNNKNDSKLCADFLSCIWCKYYRVVVDPEHVWKLLSYKNYILLDMTMSIVDLDDNNNQIASINILKQRVDDIISHLRERNSKAVEDGFKLLELHGIHEDWEFASPPILASKEISDVRT